VAEASQLTVIARSASDEAFQSPPLDCFAMLAMTKKGS
jgi:hypothetical protein